LAYKIQRDISPIVRTIETTPVHSNTPMPSVIKDQINPKFTFERFVVGSSNRFATASAEAVAKNPGKQFNPLFIYGGVGLGKTHLLHAIGNSLKKGFPNFRILYVTCEKFSSDFIEAIRFSDKMSVFKNKYRNLDCLLIDDIQFLMGKEKSQEEFFNLFNTLKDNGKQIVIASDRPQDKLEVEERLMSRFKWGNTVDIQKPDLETRIAILRKKAEEEQFSVPDDIVLFIAKKIKSNIRELEGSLLRVTSFIKFTNTPFTLDTVKAILKDVGDPDENITVTIEKIQETVANEYNLTVKDLKGKKRSAQIALPRQIAMYLARTMIVDISTTDIGDAFGGRDHTTVMHACNKIKVKLESDAYFVALVNKIIKEIKTED
jgi:chromosomal replication initiator protein